MWRVWDPRLDCLGRALPDGALDFDAFEAEVLARVPANLGADLPLLARAVAALQVDPDLRDPTMVAARERAFELPPRPKSNDNTEYTFEAIDSILWDFWFHTPKQRVI